METVVRTQTFKVNMSRHLHVSLDVFLEQQRQLWNGALQERIEAYSKCSKSISSYDQMKSLTEIRKDCDGFSGYFLMAQRTSLVRLDKAFQSFFRRAKNGEAPGFPRFKARGRVKSFEVPSFRIHGNGIRNSVAVKGIGRFRFRGEVEGTPKLVRIIKSPSRVKIQVVCEIEKEIVEDSRSPLGIDVGIKERVTLSNGYQVPKRILDRSDIKKHQRILSRAKKKSNSRSKKRLALQKVWQKAQERELGVLHELTADLIKNHGSKFFVEDLKIGNMTKNHNLARSILEQQWGTFNRLLNYKAEEAGGWVEKVNPRNTSQWCSECGGLPTEKLTLKDRIYHCEHCGNIEDRDVNAALNILKIGLSKSVKPAGNPPVRREEEDRRSSLGDLQDAERCILKQAA